MTEQYIVEEIQNKAIIPFVFRVGEGEGEYATPKAAEQAAKAKFHNIMERVYSLSLAYNGAIMIHQYGENPAVIDMYEIAERTV